MAQPLLVVEGLDELRREFRDIDRKLPTVIGKANKRIAQRILPEVQNAVRSLPTPGGTKGAPKVTARGSQKKAEVVFSSRVKTSGTAIASVLGANTHPVFGRRYPASILQNYGRRNRVWQPHLGSSWQPETLYGVGPVFKQWRDNFQMQEYQTALDEALRDWGK